MTTFWHTGDWQISRPFGSFEAGAKATALQQARLKAVEELGRLVNASGAEAVLVCGDLFDSPLTIRSMVCQTLELIGKMGCGVLAIPGNHDHGGPGTLWREPYFEEERRVLAPNLTVLLESKPHELDRLVLLPCPLLERRTGISPLAWLAGPEAWARLPKDKPRVVMAHGAAQSFLSGSETEGQGNLLDLNLLPEGEVDYVALGDWHGMKQVGPRAWYSGALEPDRFPRGADYRSGLALRVGMTGRGGTVEVEAMQTGQVRWISETVFVEPVTGVEPVETWLEATIGPDVCRHVVRLELEGSLGLEDFHRLEKLLERFGARALDLQTVNRVAVAPGAADLEELTGRPGDPVIAAVARRLLNGMGDSGKEMDRAALLTLHRLVRQEEAA